MVDETGLCKNGYWNRVEAQFKRGNDFLPGLLAPPLTGAISGVSGWVSRTTGIPSIAKWVGTAIMDRALPQYIINGSVLSRAATFGMSAASSITSGLIVGAAYETGLFIGSMISAGIWDYGDKPCKNPCKD